MTHHDSKVARALRADDAPAQKEVPRTSPTTPELLTGMPKLPVKHSRRLKPLTASFLLVVMLPFFIASCYWLFLASDRYLAGSGFAVRSMSDNAGGDLLGSLTGLVGATSTTSDTGIVLRFLESRDLVERVMQDIDLRSAFSAEAIDPLFRLTPADAPIEDLLEYWRARIFTTHDATTGLITFHVEAFNAADALAISRSVLAHVEDQVNRISAEARREVLNAAEAEVARAEARLREATETQRRFRTENRILDPLGNAGGQTRHVVEIEERLSATRRQIMTLERQIEHDSPQLVTLRHEEAGLVEQLAAVRARSGEQAELLERFEATELEKTIARESYASTLISLEAARVRADSAQRYLAVFQEPKLAQSAELPRRWINVALTLIALIAFWAIAALIATHIRDRMR